MIRKLQLLALLFFLCGTVYLFSQEGDHKDFSLRERVDSNINLLYINENKACLEIEALLKEAEDKQDTTSELILLGNRLWCLDLQMNMEKSIEAAQHLKTKAVAYNHFQMEAMAHLSMLRTYNRNGLYEHAFREFDNIMLVLKKTDPDDSNTSYAKVNALINRSEIFSNLGKHREALQSIFRAGEENQKDKRKDRREKMSPMINAGIAYTYLSINLDSAEYFVYKSLKSDPDTTRSGITAFTNHLTLGEIHRKKRDYQKAIENYTQAEKIIPLHTDIQTIEEIYKGLAESYKALGNMDDANAYEQKLKDVQLEVANNKNNSLHKIINENLLKEKAYSWYIGIGSGILLLIMFLLLVRSRRKNKLLEQQEEAGKVYLDEVKPSQLESQEVYTQLVEMAKNDDRSFIIAFHEKFPDFYEKLQKLNPKLVESEIEFCALLKMKLSTKEIAQIKNIEPKTVKNKKNRIRKRLNIPLETELYYYFNQL